MPAIGVKKQVEDFMIMMLRLFVILSLYVLMACNPAPEETNIPNVRVDIEVDLNSIDSQPLQPIGGFIYLTGGVRGIVLIHTGLTEYVALDRNCTFEPGQTDAIVDMHDSGFYLEDITCTSTFDHNGFPTGGPAPFPLKKYRISRSGDLLFIMN